MNTQSIMSYIDHTQLKAFATWEDIETLCREALQYKTASVCIPPCYVKRVHEHFQDALPICTVIGFPLGYSTTSIKITEAKDAIANGASEIDMVINITDVKNGNFAAILKELCALRLATEGHILKVIIEACYLTESEKIRLCELITQAEADFIKTSTGFGTGGALKEDILLFQKHIGPNVKIKAAGGIKTLDDLKMFIDLGCARIGTSSAVALLAGEQADTY